MEASRESVEYVGDVGGKPLFQDELATISVVGPGGAQGTPTGTLSIPSADLVITQTRANGDITNSSKFVFASTDGAISAWTEHNNGGGNLIAMASS